MDETTSSVEIVERAKQYDRDAFGELYELYYEKVFRYLVFKSRNIHIAEDLTEQVFLTVLEKINTLRNNNLFLAWTMKIAHNLFINQSKELRNNKMESISDYKIVDPQLNPKYKVENKLLNEEIYKAIRKLNKNQQKVIIYKFLANMSNKEIGLLLGKKEGAIKSLQVRALTSLSKYLKGVVSNE